jgi:F-type H+-transporting ATPase subunit c
MLKRVVVGLLAVLWISLPLVSLAEEGASAEAGMGTGAKMEAGKAPLSSETKKWMAVAAGFGIALAAFGGALAQSRAVAAALTGIARNPGASGKIFTPMILGLVLIESLVIYALVITYSLASKI